MGAFQPSLRGRSKTGLKLPPGLPAALQDEPMHFEPGYRGWPFGRCGFPTRISARRAATPICCSIS